MKGRALSQKEENNIKMKNITYLILLTLLVFMSSCDYEINNDYSNKSDNAIESGYIPDISSSNTSSQSINSGSESSDYRFSSPSSTSLLQTQELTYEEKIIYHNLIEIYNILDYIDIDNSTVDIDLLWEYISEPYFNLFILRTSNTKNRDLSKLNIEENMPFLYRYQRKDLEDATSKKVFIKTFFDMFYSGRMSGNEEVYEIPFIDARDTIELPDFDIYDEQDYSIKMLEILEFAYSVTDLQRIFEEDPYEGGKMTQIFRIEENAYVLCQWDWNAAYPMSYGLIGNGFIFKLENEKIKIITNLVFIHN